MLDAILGTKIIQGSEQSSKGLEKTDSDNGDLFSQILNFMQNSDGKIDSPKKEGNFLWDPSIAQLLENGVFLGEKLSTKQITEEDPLENEVPFLIDESLIKVYQREGTIEEAVDGETIDGESQKVFVDYPDEQLKTDGSEQKKDFIQVVDNKETKMIKQNLKEPVDQKTLAQRGSPEDNSPLAISKVEGNVEKLAANGLDLEVTEENDDNKVQVEMVDKKNDLEEAVKTLQGQTNSSSDLSQNNETQHSQQFNLGKSETKANLEQISQGNEPVEGDNPVSPKELPKYILEQLKNNFRTNKADNTSEVTIRLKPESLGKITLHLTTEGEKLSIRIFTESSLSKALVEQNMSLLRQALEEQGIKSKSINVEVGGDNLSQHFNQQREHQTKGNSAYFINKNKKEYSAIKVEERTPLKITPRKANGLSRIEILA